MRAKNPPILQYICLAVLFAVAAGYQTRCMLYSFPDYFHLRVAANPFYADYSNGKPIVQFVSPPAQHTGIKENDILVALNGHPLTGLAVFGEALRLAKPGDSLSVEVLTPGDSASRTATFTLWEVTSPDVGWAAISLLSIKLVMPTFCILLGFWVAAVRPRDPSAWLLCLIMLFFSVFYSVGVESWGPVVRDIARAYRVAVTNAWPIFMLLFGIYFPEPFPGKKSALWKWAKRIAIGVLILFTITTVIEKMGLDRLEHMIIKAS